MQEVLSLAIRDGARKAELLHLSVPSHCPLMQPVAESLHRQLQSIEVRNPQFVYISNVGARSIRSAAGVQEDLASNIAHRVRWHDATAIAQQLGRDLFLEMPPGHVLSDLVSENLRGAKAYPVDPEI
jgi:malonate decarboxylase epsilon subunit